jgi:hypothetical protein
VVLASFSEILLAQCFYNPEIVQIVRTLVGGGMVENRDDDGYHAFRVFQRSSETAANLPHDDAK